MSDTNERTDLLAMIPLFAGLKRKHLSIIAKSARSRSVSRYTKLISQGEKGDSCYLIIEGTAEVRHDTQPVAELERGAVFGELALWRSPTEG